MINTPDRQAVWPDDELAAEVVREPPRRPVCGLAIAFCSGIALGLEYPVAAGMLLLAGGLCALAALRWRRHAAADFLLAAGLVCVGWAHASLCAHSPGAREVAALLGRPAEYVAVIGEVRDAPAWQNDERTGEIIWTFPVRLEGLRRVTAWQRAAGTVEGRLRLAKSGTPPQCGERWLFTGLLEPHTRWRAGGEAPAGYRMTADADASRRLGPAGPALYAICMRARAACSVLLGRGLKRYPEQAGLLRAVILNTREEMGEAMYRDFSVTGTMHIVAISGLHVAVIALLLLGVLRATGLTQPYWFFLLAPLLVFYTMMTGLVPSATRSCCMALIFWLAPFLQRRPDGLTSLAWSAILILAWEPAQFLDIGFLLSFSAVLGLILIYGPWSARVKFWLRSDPWQLQAERPLRRWLRSSARHILLLALTAVVANLATGPLIARYFNLLSPVALLSNLAVVPAAVLMITLGCLSLFTGAVWTPLAEIFNSANLPVISFIMRCTEWSAALPGGHVYVRSPAWFWIAVYYGALVLLLIGGARTRRVVALAVLLAGGGLAWRIAADRSLAVHVWRLGPALIALVDAPGSDKLLVNTGPRFAMRALLRRLHAEGVGDLRALVLTRGNSDHSGGASNLLQAVAVREIWLAPGMATNFMAQVSGASNVLVKVSSNKTWFAKWHVASEPSTNSVVPHYLVRRLEAGMCVPLAGAAELDVVYPPKELRTRRSENRAAVFRLTRAPVTLLFLNDAGAGTVAGLQARLAVPAATVVLAGNALALAPAWLAALGVRDVLTPGVLLRDVQERQAAVEQGGVRLWRMEEGDVLHIVWPAGTNAPAAALITASPWSPVDPTTF
jgi:competence protein ComEC